MPPTLFFSLDALVSLPGLFVPCLQRVTQLDKDRVSAALIEAEGEPLRALRALVDASGVANAYPRFLREVAHGAHREVKPEVHRTLDACRAAEYRTVAFYRLPEQAVKDIVKSAKLRVDASFGYQNFDELDTKVDGIAGSGEVRFILGMLTRLPEEYMQREPVRRSYRTSNAALPTIREELLG